MTNKQQLQGTAMLDVCPGLQTAAGGVHGPELQPPLPGRGRVHNSLTHSPIVCKHGEAGNVVEAAQTPALERAPHVSHEDLRPLVEEHLAAPVVWDHAKRVGGGRVIVGGGEPGSARCSPHRIAGSCFCTARSHAQPPQEHPCSQGAHPLHACMRACVHACCCCCCCCCCCNPQMPPARPPARPTKLSCAPVDGMVPKAREGGRQQLHKAGGRLPGSAH
jgi:hypothetical protein